MDGNNMNNQNQQSYNQQADYQQGNQQFQQQNYQQQYNQQQYEMQQQYYQQQYEMQQQYYQQLYEQQQAQQAYQQQYAQHPQQEQQYDQQPQQYEQPQQQYTQPQAATGNNGGNLSGGNGGKKKTGLIIGIIAAILVIAAVIVTIIIVKNKKNKDEKTTTETTTEVTTTEETTEATTEATTEETTETTTEVTTEEVISGNRYYKLVDMKSDTNPEVDGAAELQLIDAYYVYAYLILYENGTGYCNLFNEYIVDDITYDENSVTAFGVTVGLENNGDQIRVYSEEFGAELTFEEVSKRDFDKMIAFMEGPKDAYPAHSFYNIGEKLVENTSFNFGKMYVTIPKDFDVIEATSNSVSCQLTSDTNGALITYSVKCVSSENSDSTIEEMAEIYGVEFQNDYQLSTGTVLDYYSTGTKSGVMFNALSEDVTNYEESYKECNTRYYIGLKEEDGYIYKIEIYVDDDYFREAGNNETIGGNLLNGVNIEYNVE